MNRRSSFQRASQPNRLDQRFDFEKLEDRNLLSASAGDLGGFLLQGQEQLILDYLADQPDTSYLQDGANSLELVRVENGDAGTTAVFQQLLEGLSIHGTFVTVTQDSSGQILGSQDSGAVHLATQDSLSPGIDFASAKQIANQGFAGQNELTNQGELVWFRSGYRAELAWQIESIVPGANVNHSDLEFQTIVDANTGSVLSQVQSPSIVDHLATGIGIYPRIVINDTIGPAGSQAYAAPFDSVIALPGCTGTLVAPNVVISARHCGAGPEALSTLATTRAIPIFQLRWPPRFYQPEMEPCWMVVMLPF